MRSIIPTLCAAALVGCGGAPEPAPDAPASAPAAHPHHEQPMHHGEHGHHHHHHGFEDPARWAEKWDTDERDAWQKPEAVLALIAPKPADLIADIGAGTGYFAVRLAAAAPEGEVYAIDLGPEMVQYLGERAAKLALGNLRPLLATADDPKIPQPVDLVMLTNTYHHIGERVPYFTRLAAHLKPAGRVAIVDYKLQFDGPGPPEGMRLAPDAVVAEMTAAGYRVTLRDEDTLPRQYVLIFDREP